jgi:bifunctional enzyme CysN/CysC
MAEADQFEAELRWRCEEHLVPGRRYVVVPAGANRPVGARIAIPKYRLDDDGQRLAARTLRAGELGVAVITTERPIPADGAFELADPDTGAALASGTISFALRRSRNLHWQEVAIDKSARIEQAHHNPAVVWFTGLSGSGKSAIANEVERRLYADGIRTYLLDGDNVRQGLNKDLGFTEADRIENIRRVGEVAKLMVDAGVIVLVAFISPFRDERSWARGIVEPGEFCEVFVDTPLHVAESRDAKGLYAKARRGELKNFTGIDSPYEPPVEPEVHLRTVELSPGAAAELVIDRLAAIGVIPAR